MNDQNNLLLNVSALYRNVNKYFDKHLSSYDIGAGQMIPLILINEHEGLTMQQLTNYSEFDKGTTTKVIQKLLETGYIDVVADEQDKRIKRLYTTAKSRQIINSLYQIRNDCTSQLMKQLDSDQCEQLLQKISNNSRTLAIDDDYTQIRIAGLQKLTLLDYPGKVACTIFTAGCNFKCPFCHNKDLVYIPEDYQYYSADDILAFLEKRAGLLDGVAITGGEPLIQPGIFDLIDHIKQLGYLVKLDTNGAYPNQLKKAVELCNVDYVAVDIKNVREKYSLTTGVSLTDKVLDNIEESISYLMQGKVDYEFRTTVVADFHTLDDLKAIAEKIKGSRYFLQTFKNSGNLINPQCTGYTDQKMQQFLQEVQKINETTYLR